MNSYYQTIRRFVLDYWRYLAAAAVVLAIGGYFAFGRGGDQGATLTITQDDFVKQVRVSGTVIAAKDVDLGFASSGRITGTYAIVGQHVGAGTLLAQIENGDLVAALGEATAAYNAAVASRSATSFPEATTAARNAYVSAYATLDNLLTVDVDIFFGGPTAYGPTLLISAPMYSFGELPRARATLTEVMQAYQRTLAAVSSKDPAELLTNGNDTAQAVSNFLDKLAVAANARDSGATVAQLSALVAARESVHALLATLSTARDTYLKNSIGSTSLADANVEQARSNVNAAKAALGKTYVVAPFAGIVTRMDAKQGAIVSPSTSLISMQSDGVFQIETFVPEVTIADIAVGNSATTTLDAYGSSVEFPSRVIAVDPAETVKDGVPAYKTTLAFLSADPRIRSGMTANVVMVTGVLHDAIVIPEGAVGHSGGEAYVSVVADGKATKRTVTTGSSPALGQAHILSGLSAGDAILLAPASS